MKDKIFGNLFWKLLSLGLAFQVADDYLDAFGKREGIAAERELYAPSDTTKPLFPTIR